MNTVTIYYLELPLYIKIQDGNSFCDAPSVEFKRGSYFFKNYYFYLFSIFYIYSPYFYTLYMIIHTVFIIQNTNTFELNETNIFLDISIQKIPSGYIVISSTPELGQDITTVPNKSKLISLISALIYTKFSQLFDQFDFPLTRYIISLALQEGRSIIVLQAIQNHIASTIL